ncbi:hypothetical protein [Clostridium tetani]|uniref:Uncharacterized protein n=1 Tax=Clostridium tetani (strain Massachusetts / E88) TaxID=212717 RepID=Q89A08_CLOTE|nr:hypothetical protein [Clostridium tetani]AAO37402.1 hypothetical protein CTC_p6 [Clostridium tetani E88]KGI36652.1 hypothetical protein KY52_13085 [Clostridium tetani]KGI42922.1 hypothetical protein KY55_08380 [Clostridium tetani]KHO30811.1 hypothetical protein OR63_13600 [Clostridium tetani]KIG19859.1 hypothetical protein RS78_12705 [Clostridium tetani]
MNRKQTDKFDLLNQECENTNVNIFNSIKADLLELVDIKPELIKLLEDYKSSGNILDIEELNINNLPEEFKNKIEVRSIKIYNKVYNEFNKLCNQYKGIKKQDLLSLALYEFCKKYRK